jgi:hypothetical protein
MTGLTAAQVRRWRARAQGLYSDEGAGRTVLDAVRLAGGLQAQDAKAARLQVRARSGGLTAADLDAACGAADRSVVRGWLMRGTLHAVPATDLRWLTALLGQRVADSARGRRRQLGLDDELCGRALTALERVLAGRPPMTRDGVVAALAGHGIVLDPRSQAPAHLMLYAAATGLVCRGPETAADVSTYVLREEWLAAVPAGGPEGDEALAELAVRHATSYGPSTAADFARWSGLPLGAARRGRAAAGRRIAEVEGPDGPLAVAAGTEPPHRPAGVRLTGHFDPYLLGYADRDLLLAPSIARRIATGGGLLMPCVLYDGEVVATWRHTRRAAGLTLHVEPLAAPFPAAVEPALDAETADLGRFLSVPAGWEWAAPS